VAKLRHDTIGVNPMFHSASTVRSPPERRMLRSLAVTPDEVRVYELLREKVGKAVPRRDFARFDRLMGKSGQGWTSLLLRGKAPVPTLGTLLAVLHHIEIAPSKFFAEAFPSPSAETDEDALIQLFLKSLEGGPVASLFDRVVAEKVAEAVAPLLERLKKLEGGQ
jgi:hypothetical protein